MDMNRVDFVSNEEIERKAITLLYSFLHKKGLTEIAAPVPIDEIIPTELGVDFEIDDLSAMLGEGVLGATWMDGKGRIVVEQALEKDATGRFEFTQAHEVGHWVLHRQKYIAEQMQTDLFDTGPKKPAVVCRDIGVSNPKKPRGEYQADLFAGALLMPHDLVRVAYQNTFNLEPLVLGTMEHPVNRRDMMQHPQARQAAKRILDEGGFENVSIAAMVVRLNHLGFFKGEPDATRSLFEMI